MVIQWNITSLFTNIIKYNSDLQDKARSYRRPFFGVTVSSFHRDDTWNQIDLEVLPIMSHVP